MTLRYDAEVEAALARALAGLDFVDAAYAFGSRVRGNARSDSDLDLAVLVRPGQDLYEAGKVIAGTAGRVFPADHLDIVLLNQAPPLLRHRIFRDGRLIYERDPATRVRFQVSAMHEYFDLQHMRDYFFQKRRETIRRRLAHGGSRDPAAQD